MKKFISITLSTIIAVSVVMSVTAAYAAPSFVNSIGSVASDAQTQGNNPAITKTDGITGYDDTQDRESEYQKVDTDGEYHVDIYATQEAGTDITDEDGIVVASGDIEVTIPKAIIVPGDNSTGVAEYTLVVKGNIAGTGTIKVAPVTNDDTVVCKGENVIPTGSSVTADAYFYMGQEGKYDIVGSVTQEKKNFSYTDTDATIDSNGVYHNSTNACVQVTNITAGVWNGTFSFDIEYTE